MVFRFLILSDEVDDFTREIQIDSESTFLDLHSVITKSVGYEDISMASFFICDNDWAKEREITLVEMDTSSDEDSYIMADSVLNDFLEDERQKLIYMFDYLTERGFFMELREIITGQYLDKPVCTKSIGNAPEQAVDFEVFEKTLTSSFDTGENFYGEDQYDVDELDLDGFDGLDEASSLSEGEGGL